MRTKPSKPLRAALVLTCLALASPALAAPEDNALMQQIRSDTRNVQNGGHGLFTNVTTFANALHDGDPAVTNNSYFASISEVGHRAKAEVRLAGVKQTVYDGNIYAIAFRNGRTGYENIGTCAQGTLRVLGKETFPTVGRCMTGVGHNTQASRADLDKTFFSARHGFTLAFVPCEVTLKASGQVGISYNSTGTAGNPFDAKNPGYEASTANAVFNAMANLRATGEFSVGIPYVAGGRIRGTIDLVKLSFTPQQTSSRQTYYSLGYYLLQSVAPFTIEALNGKIEALAYGPFDIIVDKVTIWDPPAIARWNTSLISANWDAYYWFLPH